MNNCKHDQYTFSRYMSQRRWMSLWHQVDETLSLACRSVLEIGPGPGLFEVLARRVGLQVTSLDINMRLKPQCLGKPTELPFPNRAFELCCAFQVLEHLPFEDSLAALIEMARVAEKNVLISLPDARVMWPFTIHVPKVGDRTILMPKPSFLWGYQEGDHKHFWEINCRGFELKRVLKIFDEIKSIKLRKTFRVPHNPYHRFFVFDKI